MGGAESRTITPGPPVAAALWGGMYVVSKWGFESIPPVTLAFLRVLLGAVTLLLVVRVAYPRRSFSRTEWRGFAFLGLWVAITMATQFVGTDLTTASEGALVTVLTPVFTLLLGVAVLDESVNRRTAVGMALAFAGTLWVVAGQYDLATPGGGNPATPGGANASTLGAAGVGGVALLVLASVGWAAYTVWGKPLVRRYSALETATYSTVAAVPMLAALVPVELAVRDVPLAGIAVTPALVAAVAYLGVASTALAWYCWYRGLETADAGTVAVYFFAQPAVGAALGAVLLDETLSSGFFLGGATMAVGIYLVSVADAG
ncbi:DMT family transporter [Halorarum salinum]|uniref:DMT family transporter n=1 Tax=Halorarum salinum TaxID=2743089 RepID=A0A7D5LC08_9EURY|nr:DMT family transporter [Halobaculum salinum]QLG63010.1 DMT family transporter [Halobaculum salinum]